MKYSLCITLVALLCGCISAQTASRGDEADAMKKAVEIITAAKKKPSVDVVLRDLREIDGKIIRVYDDSFVVDRKQLMTIRYRDVLQIEGKGAVLSFVPDPKLTPYSEWNAIPTVGVGAKLQIHTRDGKKTHGVLTTWADDRIRLMQGNTQIEIARNYIVRVYQLAGDTDGLATRLFGGGRRGTEVAEGIFPILDAAARAHPFGLAIGAAIGIGTAAVMHVLPKGGVKRVLVYAA